MPYRKQLSKGINSNRPFTTTLFSYIFIIAISGCDREKFQTETTDSSNKLEQSSLNVELPPPLQKTVKTGELDLSLPQEIFDTREKDRLNHEPTSKTFDNFSTRSEAHYKITGKPLINIDSEEFSSSEIDGGKVEIKIQID